MKPNLTHLELAADKLRRWWPWLVLSFVLHLPLTPAGQFVGVLGLLTRLKLDVPEEPVEVLEGIPVELLQGPSSPAVDDSKVAAAVVPDENVPVVIPPPQTNLKKRKEPEPLDGGVDDASVPDAGARTAFDGGGAYGDAGVSSDAGIEKADPFAIIGDLPKPQKTNVNVKIYLFANNLRKHPAGRAIASLLSRERQWQDFLGPTGLDPVQDISRIVIYGPQLVDSSQIAVLLEYSKETKEVITAVDSLVKSSEGGHWETENKKRVAYVRAAGAERAIVFFPGKLIAIAPPGPVEAQFAAMKSLPALPAAVDEQVVFQGSLRTPHRVRFFSTFGLSIPKSISEGNLRISALPNGGALLNLELSDESPEAAAQHMDDFERTISSMSGGFVSPRWHVNGSSFIAETSLSPSQVGVIVYQIDNALVDARRNKRGRTVERQKP